MSKFKVNDRVAVYSAEDGLNGDYSTVTRVHPGGRIVVKTDSAGNKFDVFPQQLRKLKSKVKAVKKPQREWFGEWEQTSHGLAFYPEAMSKVPLGTFMTLTELHPGEAVVSREGLLEAMRKEFPGTALGPWFFNFLDTLNLPSPEGKGSK